MRKLLGTAVLAALLAGCSAATPLLLAEAGGHQVARHDEDIKVRAAAALKEEPDLLTFSVQAISRGKTEEAVQVYMKGYSDKSYSDNMKSLALYQIALLYMNQFNDDRNDDRALQYLNRHLIEFPASRMRERVQAHINIIEARKAEGVQHSAVQLLKQVNRAELLKTEHNTYDNELTDMSERAITENRTADAEGVYLVLYDNKASSSDMRAKALYQIGLIYMSPYNKEGNNKKALGYFRKITEEFPNTDTSKKAQKRISELLNTQP